MTGEVTTKEEYARWLDHMLLGALGLGEQDKPAEASEASKVVSDEDRENTEYIHVRSVSFVHSGGRVIRFAEEMMWRGRLEAVDGFVVGRFADEGDRVEG